MIRIELKCNSYYDFNSIKEVTFEKNGIVRILGNFKPKGKYKEVVLFSKMVKNPSIFNNLNIKSNFGVE